MTPELAEAIEFHRAIIAEGGKALVGYDTAKALANVVLLSEIPTTYDKSEQRQVNAGNLLLRGVPGVGKTFFGVILAAISDAKFARIQGRADLQPTEVVGFQMINPSTGELVTEFGPLASAEVILLDEINRIPLKSQSAFLEGLQDRTITVGKETYELPAFSFAIATMNPIELGQGTFPLSEAATDRFAIMINIGYLPPAEEEKLVNFDFKRVRLNTLMSKERIIQLRGAINEQVFLHERLGRYIQRLVAATRPYNPDTDWPRPLACRSSSSKASISAPRRARSSAGDVSPRSGRCSQRGRTEVYPGRHPGSRPLRARPPHLAGTARRQPRPDDRSRHPGHHRAGADSMRLRSDDRESLVSLADITEIELVILKRMREVTIGDHRSRQHGTGLRLRRPARLAARRSLLVDRLGPVDAHQLLAAHRPRVRTAEHGDGRGGRRSVAVDALRRATASRSPRRSRAPSPRSGCRRCSFRIRSASSPSTPASRISAASGPRTGKSHVVHCLDAYERQHGLQEVPAHRKHQRDAVGLREKLGADGGHLGLPLRRSRERAEGAGAGQGDPRSSSSC